MKEVIVVNIKTIDNVKKFVKITESSGCDIYAKQGRYIVDAKSIMGILSLNLLDDIVVEIDTDNWIVNEELKIALEEFK